MVGIECKKRLNFYFLFCNIFRSQADPKNPKKKKKKKVKNPNLKSVCYCSWRSIKQVKAQFFLLSATFSGTKQKLSTKKNMGTGSFMAWPLNNVTENNTRLSLSSPSTNIHKQTLKHFFFQLSKKKHTHTHTHAQKHRETQMRMIENS